MSEEIKSTVAEISKTRRAFVKTAAQVAVTAPAVGLLLSASTKPVKAEPIYGPGTSNAPGFGDNAGFTTDDGFDDFYFTPGDDFVP